MNREFIEAIDALEKEKDISKEKEQIPGLHSAEYRFDDHVLKGAAGVFAALGYYGCMGILQKQEKGTGTEEWKK